MTSDKNDRPDPKAGTRKEPTSGAPSSKGQAEDKGERIAKRLARAGIASRRDAEGLVEAGRVSVNGKVLASPAFNVQPNDRIELDGKPLPAIERTRLFLFNKPAGIVTTSRDPEGRRTVFDALPEGLPRLITVGRLDINTEGLLVLTNDGGLARMLELPATGWLRRYRVRVHGKVDPAALEGLKEGIAVDGVFYGAIEATLDREQGSNAWLTVGLREGKNREVKNILGALGLDVTRLIRISYGPFQLGTLAEGAVQEIKGRTLREQLGERLVAQSGANFDAPVIKPFSNKPVRAGEPVRKAEEAPKSRGDWGDKEKGAREPTRTRFEKGDKPFRNTKREREDRREEMRGRLQTKPGARAEDKERASGSQARGNRGAHVWMAPGARPLGKKRRDEDAQTDERRRPATRRDNTENRNTSRPEGRRQDRHADKKPFSGAGKPKEFRSRDGEKPAFDGDKRPRDGDKRQSPRPFAKGKPSGFSGKGKPGGAPGKGKPTRPDKPTRSGPRKPQRGS